jgi:hypothetical protein
MQPLSRSRLALSLPLALTLSVLLAGQSLAATWSPPITLASAVAHAGLITLGTSKAVVTYTTGSGVFARRSTDAGKTWAAAVRLSTAGHTPAISGRGTAVDVVWTQSGGDTLRYARSTNSGGSFKPALTLSEFGHLVAFPAVARGPNGRVLVSWCDDGAAVGQGYSIKVRVSKDGGVTFAPAKTVASVPSVAAPVVAAGKGVLYVAYPKSGLRVARSINSGSTWDSPRLVAANVYADPLTPPSMTAAGSAAYIAFVAAPKSGGPEGLWVRYSRTTTKGAAWSSPADLSAKSGPTSRSPAISLRAGVVRVAFDRSDGSWFGTQVIYRQSSNGTSWTTAETIAGIGSAEGVGYAGRIIVLYNADGPLLARSAKP